MRKIEVGHINIDTSKFDTPDRDSILDSLSSLSSLSALDKVVKTAKKKKKKEEKKSKKDKKGKENSEKEHLKSLLLAQKDDDDIELELDRLKASELEEGDDEDSDSVIERLLKKAEDEEDEDFDGSIISSQKDGYGARKKDKNEYKKEFNEEITLLYSMLEDTNTLSKLSEKQWKSMSDSRARGSSKFTNDLLQNIINLRGNKLQIIKEITSIKRTIADLQLKKDRASGAANAVGETSHDDIMSIYMNQIMENGRGKFVEATSKKATNAYLHDEDDDDGEDYYQTALSAQESIDIRLKNTPTRSATGTTYIQMENDKCVTHVKRNIDTGDWKFIAIDRDGQERPEYPVPDGDLVGPLSFGESIAKDKLGRSYKLIDVYDDLY